MALLNRSSARPKLVEPSGFDSPARANLAIAIKSRDALLAGAEQIRVAALNYENDKLHPLREAIEAANTALGAAKTSVTSGIINEILTQDNSTAPKPDAIRDARLILQVAKDQLAAAEDAYGGLEPRREKMEKDASAAAEKVKQLAAEVLRDHPLVKSICIEHEKHARDFLRTLGAISWFERNNVFGLRDAHGFPLDIQAQSAVQNLIFRERAMPPHWTVGDMKGGGFMQAVATDWQAAFDALQHNANAPMPEVKHAS